VLARTTTRRRSRNAGHGSHRSPPACTPFHDRSRQQNNLYSNLHRVRRNGNDPNRGLPPAPLSVRPTNGILPGCGRSEIPETRRVKGDYCKAVSEQRHDVMPSEPSPRPAWHEKYWVSALRSHNAGDDHAGRTPDARRFRGRPRLPYPAWSLTFRLCTAWRSPGMSYFNLIALRLILLC